MRYDSYVPVDSAWLQEIPSHWNYTRPWPHFKVVEDRAGSRAESLELMSVSQRLGVVPRATISDKEPRADDLSNYRRCRAGDVIVNRMSAYQGAVGVSPQDGMVSPDYLVLRCSERLQPQFFVHLLKSPGIIGEIVLRLRGIGSPGAGTVRTPRIGAAELGQISIPLPPISEQNSTLRALDDETAQIDDLIGKQERLIELLTEKRQAVIAHAVTKGLDPTAPTKPSGIPWLGEVPSHWTVPQLGMHARVGNGSTPNRDTAEYWSGGEIPWLNSSHVNRDEITDADQFVSEAATAECHLPLVGAESLLIGLTGQGRTRGMTSILRFPATINQHVAYVTPETSVWNPEYLLWFLRSSYDRLRELSDENGSTKGALTCTAVKKLNVTFPPLSEQNAIAANISEQLAGLDRIAAASTAAVELLRERRSALISAAVTGKIDVRKEAS
ncbi:MAG TPA: hypothetical protein DEV93_05690 [Chloroflexi bacterium]|jgi:type I restriction enzyme S subunit|nr:hypothetical protein [Chloroflexota bacterium]